jgi:hypothetical protein
VEFDAFDPQKPDCGGHARGAGAGDRRRDQTPLEVDLSVVASKWDVAETRTDLLHGIVYTTAELTQT